MLRTITTRDIALYTKSNIDQEKRKRMFACEQPVMYRDLKITIEIAEAFETNEDIEVIFAQFIQHVYRRVFGGVFRAEQPILVDFIKRATVTNSKSIMIYSMVDNVFVIYDLLKQANNTMVN